MKVSPYKLEDGSWGIVTDQDLKPGDIVTVVTQAGKEWEVMLVNRIKPGPWLRRNADWQRGHVWSTRKRPQPPRFVSDSKAYAR